MNKKFLVAAVGAALAVAGSSAYALDAKISGQVSRALMRADDGLSTEMHHVDGADATRFRFTGSEEILPGLKAGILWEMEYLSNPSSKANNGALAGTPVRSTSPTLDERHINVYFEGAFGHLSLGQGNGAGNGVTESDLSGTTIINTQTVQDWGGAMQFRDLNNPGSTSGPTVTSVINNLDLESRYDRLYYRTPDFGGVKVSASTGTKANFTVSEVGVWYDGDFGAGGKLSAAVGKSVRDTGAAGNSTTSTPAMTGDVETTGMSISWLAPFGLNLTFTKSKAEDDAMLDKAFTYFKVGYKAGMHAMAVDFAKGEDQTQTSTATAFGDEAKMVGVGYVYSPKNWADIYAGYRIYSLDRPLVTPTTFEDIKILSVGSRIKF